MPPKDWDPTKPRTTAKELLARDSGKGAVFMGAFLDFLDQHGDSALNEAQRSSIDWVVEQGGNISLNYMKTCCRHMQEAGLIEYIRQGRNYMVRLTDKGREWFKALPETWGTSLDSWPQQGTPEAVEEVKERPHRRIKARHRLDSVVWRAYLAAQNRGDLDIIFVPAGSEVRVGARGRFSAYDPGQRAE